MVYSGITIQRSALSKVKLHGTGILVQDYETAYNVHVVNSYRAGIVFSSGFQCIQGRLSSTMS